jgi:hypothetical protein
LGQMGLPNHAFMNFDMQVNPPAFVSSLRSDVEVLQKALRKSVDSLVELFESGSHFFAEVPLQNRRVNLGRAIHSMLLAFNQADKSGTTEWFLGYDGNGNHLAGATAAELFREAFLTLNYLHGSELGQAAHHLVQLSKMAAVVGQALQAVQPTLVLRSDVDGQHRPVRFVNQHGQGINITPSTCLNQGENCIKGIVTEVLRASGWAA